MGGLWVYRLAYMCPIPMTPLHNNGVLSSQYTCTGVAIPRHNSDHPLELVTIDPCGGQVPLY
jgi:hypothetical protein